MWWGRLIDQSPKDSELADRGNKLIEVHRFYNIGVCTQLISFDEIIFLARGRQDDNWQNTEPGVGPNLTQRLESVDSGHFEIEHDDRGIDRRAGTECPAPTKEIHRLRAVIHDDNFIRQI